MELDVSRGFVHPATPFPFEAKLMLEAQDVGGEAVTFDAVTLEGTYFVADDTVRQCGLSCRHGAEGLERGRKSMERGAGGRRNLPSL